MSTMRHTMMAIVLAAGAAATPTLAQNALGDGSGLRREQNQQDGTALDNSLSTRGRQNVARPSLAQETAFRNAIVTGNAPGGLSFRGDVGYRAPGEFAAALGSDSTFGFRRDSYYSGLAGQGIRGTEAIQYQFALTTGGRVPAGLGAVGFARDGSALTTRASGVGSAISPAAPGLNRPAVRLDQAGTAGTSFGSLRSTSAYTADRGLQPMLLGVTGRDAAGRESALSASALRGLRVDTLGGPEPTRDATPAGVGTPGTTRLDQRLPGSSPLSTLDTTLTEPMGGAERIDTAYDAVMSRLRERADRLAQPGSPAVPGAGTQPGTTTPGTSTPGSTTPGAATPNPGAAIPWWQEELDRLRRDLQPGVQQPGSQPGTTRPDTSDERPDARGDEDGPADERAARLLRLEGVEPVRELAGPGLAADDLFGVHMRAGEALLASGRYFDAEDRFTRALAVRPSDPTAQVGRVHAQLGASMFVSAALNIREVLTSAPALIGARFAPELLPSAERQADLKLLLRQNIGLVERPGTLRLADPQLERDSGLLLAYLGWQSNDAEATAQGLRAFEQTVGAADGTDSADAKLARLLRAVWLAPPEEPAAE